jgi:16S rRNA (adenine1518-N6/adenine1519-N6)-dimethyltransferase
MEPSISLPPLNVPALLREHGLHPKKGLGQNFLVDPGALQRVVETAEVTREDAVLEVGAGLGSLTRVLAHAAWRVVAVELDRALIPVLEEVLADFDNVSLHQGDMLLLDPAALVGQPGYLVVANIPYYITSALIRHLLEAEQQPRRIVLTVPRAVAQRITADAGDMSLLALSVQVYGRPGIAARIPAGAFFPAPKVDSAVVRVDLYAEPLIPRNEIDLFFRLAKAGFSQRRKTLRNTLSAGLRLAPAEAARLLDSAGIDPMRRAETLSLEEWGKLVEVYSGEKG